MPGPLNSIKGKLQPLGKALLLEAAPEFASGVIVELFAQAKVDKEKLTDYVENDRSLWAQLTTEQRQQVVAFGQRMGGLDFLTPELIINSIKEEFLSVASLLANWPEAAEWLQRQIDEIKAHVTNADTNP